MVKNSSCLFRVQTGTANSCAMKSGMMANEIFMNTMVHYVFNEFLCLAATFRLRRAWVDMRR